MTLGLIGGVERNENAYVEAARAAGHTLHFHSGHLNGRGSDTLAGIIRSSDLVVVVTDVNSHGAVQLARRLARKEGKSLVLQRRISPSRFAALVADLDAARAANA
ncbi:MAG: DUF2325 domain-containing protein [Myxococcota bacterium]